MQPPATIILLNGISSAGKTSIARVLQATLDTPYLQVSLDAFEDMLPARYNESGQFAWPALFPALLRGFHRSIAALAGDGNSLIVDHVMVHRVGWMSTLADCLDVLRPFPVHFVGVRCALDEAERRERARGDRQRGTAARQFPLVHRHGLYDVEVDTTSASPEACAARIRTAIAAHAPTAFARLRQLPRASIP
ncbi:MAG TPA: AAA family ATPase [Ktedonobacterales bacterium]|nr:AAA family ATPase [Ktedonobacterales bacterium]